MEHLAKAIAKLAKDYRIDPANSFLGHLTRFLATGDDKWLQCFLKTSEPDLNKLGSVAEAMARPDKLGEADRRLISLFTRCSAALNGRASGKEYGEPSDRLLGSCLERHLQCEKPGEDFCKIFRAAVLAQNVAEKDWLLMVARHVRPQAVDGRLTSAGRYLVAQDTAALVRVMPSLHYHCMDREFMPAFAREAPAALEAVMDELLRSNKADEMPRGGWEAALDSDSRRFERVVVAAFEMIRDEEEKNKLARSLEKHFPGKYREHTMPAARNIGAALGGERQTEIVRWLIEQQGIAAVSAVTEYVATWNLGNKCIQDWKLSVLTEAVKLLGRETRPALAAAMQGDLPQLRHGALELWIGLGDPADDAALEKQLLAELAATDSELLLMFIPLAASWKIERTAPRLWELIEHKSKPAREAAALALSRLCDEAVPGAVKLLSARKMDLRKTGAVLLIAIATERAHEALRLHLKSETADDVKDIIRKALAKLPAPTAAPSPAEPASPATTQLEPTQSDSGWEFTLAENSIDVAGPGGQPCFRIPHPPKTDQRGPMLGLVMGMFTAENQEEAEKRLLDGLKASDSNLAVAAVTVAAALNLNGTAPYLWPLLESKSKPTRLAAAQALSGLGDAAVESAMRLLSSRKSDTRAAAVTLLMHVDTGRARKALRKHMQHETSDDVRDLVNKGRTQEPARARAADSIPPANSEATMTNQTNQKQIEEAIALAAPRIKGLPADWIAEAALPPLYFADGKLLGPDAVCYLLYRQSREKEMVADTEAALLYAVLDRKRSGEFALAILNGYLGSRLDAKDRWALAIAGLLGDDRIVPLLSRRIDEWAQAARGKLAEYAVQALALLGSDAALLAVDAMAIRYRTKFKNIGKAASQAFAGAADARGISAAELGDRVVPWLGFKPGQSRVFEFGANRVEVSIGLDHKPAWRDLVKNKPIKALPASAPDEIKAEAKELSAGLKEAAKAQLLRVENLMVQQHRWPVTRWQELFLQHPLMFPFAARLVWGVYDKGAGLTATFRALEDRSLTNANDESVTLPAEGNVGIVHPLDLAPAARESWHKHLADYDVTPPFAQLERPVVRVAPDQVQARFGRQFKDMEINAMTFKGRAERLGWSRGSVCDAGGITHYFKPFPAAGVDVFLELDGMYVGIDMYSDIKLGKVFIVKHRSVQIGGYQYDEPKNEQDARLVAFGEVPPIAFSEGFGDLGKIAGQAGVEKTVED